MARNLLLFFILFICASPVFAQQPAAYGPARSGFHLASDSLNKFYVVDHKEHVVFALDTVPINTDTIIVQIKASDIKDKLLMARILEMQTNPYERKKEIFYMSRNYDEITIMLLQQLEPRLKK